MCGFPLTRSDRRRRRRQRYRHCCVVPRSTSTSSPFYTIPRSNGSRGVPSGILLTTHNIPTLPLCAARLYVYTYTSVYNLHLYTLTHTNVYIYTYTCIYIRIHSRRPPRLSHVATKVPFIALLAYRVPLPSPPFSLDATHPYPPFHRSGLEVNSNCVCVCAYQCLQSGSPGHLFSPRCIYRNINMNNARARRRILPIYVGAVSCVRIICLLCVPIRTL